ncbi:MAG TPA: magnesium transporter [Candidatus Binatia bacterium]|nr:magnesium transporter [Candidatus Binatia bacterium]
MQPVPANRSQSSHAAHVSDLDRQCTQRSVDEAVEVLAGESDEDVAELLTLLNPALAVRILPALPEDRRKRLMTLVHPEIRDQLKRNASYPEGSIGRLMEPPRALLGPDKTVREARQELRPVVERALISYVWIVDAAGRLLGVLVFRDLFFADEHRRVEDIMIREPFSLRPETPLLDAMREVLARHYPVYPVRDSQGVLVGAVRGQTLFEQEAIEISAQAGSMVGVEKEEHLATPWWRSFRFRHPWLQFNLLTAFAAAFVVGYFEHTIEQAVALAVFLPVLIGQAANTGAQALAVTLRGITLGEEGDGLLFKEAWVGLLNGAGTGVSAAIGMIGFALVRGHASPLVLGVVVLVAMIGSCALSGLTGALVPLSMKRVGADPANASAIFLTTVSDVASVGLLLGLGTVLLL